MALTQEEAWQDAHSAGAYRMAERSRDGQSHK